MMVRRTYPGTVIDRLNRKIAILRSFAKGARPESQVPRNLREFATWYDEELGVFPIGSPNDVSTSNARFGELAIMAQAEIDRLNSTGAELTQDLRRAKDATRKPKKRATLAEQNAKLRNDLSKAAARESAVAGQFHMMDAEVQRMQRDISSKEFRIQQLSEKNRLLTQQLHDLEEIRIIYSAKVRRTSTGEAEETPQ